MVLIDSGASINVMNSRTFEGLDKRLEQPLKLRKADLKVVTYGQDNPSLRVKGVVEVLVESENKYQNTEFYVIETSHKHLLSGNTAVQLGLLSLNTSVLNIDNSCFHTETT